MTFRYGRSRNVLWFADELRERHEVLQLPARRETVSHVLSQEGIAITRAPIRGRAYVDGADGVFVITVRRDVAGSRLTKVLLHEYAHVQLHMAQETGETARQLFPCLAHDPREAEADLLAALLWFGPNADQTNNEAIARLVAAVDAPAFTRDIAEDQQLRLGVPGGAVVFRPDDATRAINEGLVSPPKPPIYGPFVDPDRAARDRKRRLFGATGRRALYTSQDVHSPYFDWSRDGKPLRWFHPDLGWIDVYDGRRGDEQDGRSRWQLLRCGDDHAEQRVFVLSTSDRRRYVFAPGEARGRRREELTGQLYLAQRMPSTATAEERLRDEIARAIRGGAS